jgi:hypothetical protein
MPTYSFCCEDCAATTEIECRVAEYKAKSKKVSCSVCNSKNVYRDFKADNVQGSVKNVNTIGQLADKNAKKNKTKISEAKHKQKESTIQAPQPWYKNSKYGSATPKEINKMSTDQTTKYIMEGKN